MKKISFLIIGILYSLSSFGQKVALSNRVSINLTSGMETLNKDQFTSFGNTKFSHSKVALIGVNKTAELSDNKHFYKVDDVFISLVHADGAVSGTFLSEKKKENDAMYIKLGLADNYTSIIKTIKNNHVLIMYDNFENVGSYHFHCWNSSYTSVLTGFLQFDLADKDKATKIMYDILNSVEFAK